MCVLFFFQSNATKLFDPDETIVVLSGSAVATGGDEPCQRLEAMCLRDLCACNESVRVRTEGRRGERTTFYPSRYSFCRQRCDPRKYITLESYPPCYPTSRIYSFSLECALSSIREIPRASRVERNIPALSGKKWAIHSIPGRA